MNEIIRSIEAKQIRSDMPQFNVGDTVRVWVKVVEGNRERLQAFEGTVIAKRNGGVRETFTVRRVSYGIGVERTFPIHSPRVDHVDMIRRGKVRRAKLYYLRERQGKAAKIRRSSASDLPHETGFRILLKPVFISPGEQEKPTGMFNFLKYESIFQTESTTIGEAL